MKEKLPESIFSTDMYERVFNHARIMMAISSVKNGTFVEVNEYFLSTLGYSREEIIGQSSKSLGIFYDYSERDDAIELLKLTGILVDFEAKVKSKSGNILFVLFSINKVIIDNEEFILTSGVDVTPQRTSEMISRNLLKQQQVLADISQILNSTDSFENTINNVLSLIGEHTKVSRVYIFEDSDDELCTSNTYEWCGAEATPQISELRLVPYEIIPSWKPILLKEGKLISSNIDSLPEDIVSILKPQNIKSILVYPIMIKAKFYGFIGFDDCTTNREWTLSETELLRAVTGAISNSLERKVILKKLTESEMRLKLAMQSANEGLWDWSIATGNVYFNKQWCNMLGFEQGEIEPNIKSWETLVHPDDFGFVTQTLNRHLKGETANYETVHRVKTKSGEWKWILDHGMVIERGADGEPLRAIGTHIDITLQKQTEAELAKLLDMKDKFFSIIAHDLKNPFVTLMSFSEMLIDDFNDFSPEEIKANIQRILETSQITYNLLENLLAWARSQRGEIVLKPEYQSISNIVDDASSVFRMMYEKKKIRLINEIEVSDKALIDKNTITTVIRNLISNAIKYTNPGGEIIIRSSRNENNLLISVTDTGMGITPAELNKLFRIDTRLSKEGTSHERGTGLGLILCREFMEKNNGTISVKSTPRIGSIFTISFPVSAGITI